MFLDVPVILSTFSVYVPVCTCVWVWTPPCTYLANASWSLLILSNVPLVAVSMFLHVIVNESTLGLFNDAGCHGNSRFTAMEERKREWLKGSGGQSFTVCVGQVLSKMYVQCYILIKMVCVHVKSIIESVIHQLNNNMLLLLLFFTRGYKRLNWSESPVCSVCEAEAQCIMHEFYRVTFNSLVSSLRCSCKLCNAVFILSKCSYSVDCV